MNRRVHPAFTIIFALGVLGFVYLLTTNPGRLFTIFAVCCDHWSGFVFPI